MGHVQAERSVHSAAGGQLGWAVFSSSLFYVQRISMYQNENVYFWRGTYHKAPVTRSRRISTFKVGKHVDLRPIGLELVDWARTSSFGNAYAGSHPQREEGRKDGDVVEEGCTVVHGV